MLILPASPGRRWAVAALIVTLGWLATPHAVPIYDGVSQPDEPYRYVSAPAGYRTTPAVTSGRAASPVVRGLNSDGMSVQTSEQGPQASLFVPPASLAAAGGVIAVNISAAAPTDQPSGAKINGNVYLLTLTDNAGPVTLTAQAAVATIYLRATTSVQPGPVMEYRAAQGKAWQVLKTARGGQDIYVSSFPGAGQYALAFSAGTTSGSSKAPVLIVGGFVVLAGLVLIIRVRARRDQEATST